MPALNRATEGWVHCLLPPEKWAPPLPFVLREFTGFSVLSAFPELQITLNSREE